MKSDIMKRSVVVFGHKTSISMEESFWQALKDIAAAKHLTVTSIIGDISAQQYTNANLSSLIRQYVLRHFQELAKAGQPADAYLPPQPSLSSHPNNGA